MSIAPLIWGPGSTAGASTGTRAAGATHHAGDSGVASDALLAPPMGAIELKVRAVFTARARPGQAASAVRSVCVLTLACCGNVQNASASVFPPLDPGGKRGGGVGVETSSHAHVMGRARRTRGQQRYNSHATYGSSHHGSTVGRSNGYSGLSIGQRYGNVGHKRSQERKAEPVFSSRYHYK